MQWIRSLKLIFLLAVVLAGCDMRLNPTNLHTYQVSLPYNRARVSFDDIFYDDKLERVIVPAAETGTLALVNPENRAYELVRGFSAQSDSNQPVIGATSAVFVRDMLFALDRDAKMIYTIDPTTLEIIDSTPVEATPETIRFVAAANELWVTERAKEQIETFSLSQGKPPKVSPTGSIHIPSGPIALLIDRNNGLAFTNQPSLGTTAVIQVMTHSVLYNWGNGCSKARGMDIDEDRGYLFVACGEGKIVVMDIQHGGVQVTSQNYGGELDFVAYNPRLRHLYLPSGKSGIVAIFGVGEGVSPTQTAAAAAKQTKAASQPLAVLGQIFPTRAVGTPTPTLLGINNAEDNGQATPLPGSQVSLIRLGTADTALSARCVTVDNENNIWVCDPEHGQLFMIRDTFPPMGP